MSNPRNDESLPPGWDSGVDQWGRTFYIDHNTGSTHWERPASVVDAPYAEKPAAPPSYDATQDAPAYSPGPSPPPNGGYAPTVPIPSPSPVIIQGPPSAMSPFMVSPSMATSVDVGAVYSNSLHPGILSLNPEPTHVQDVPRSCAGVCPLICSAMCGHTVLTVIKWILLVILVVCAIKMNSSTGQFPYDGSEYLPGIIIPGVFFGILYIAHCGYFCIDFISCTERGALQAPTTLNGSAEAARVSNTPSTDVGNVSPAQAFFKSMKHAISFGATSADAARTYLESAHSSPMRLVFHVACGHYRRSGGRNRTRYFHATFRAEVPISIIAARDVSTPISEFDASLNNVGDAFILQIDHSYVLDADSEAMIDDLERRVEAKYASMDSICRISRVFTSGVIPQADGALVIKGATGDCQQMYATQSCACFFALINMIPCYAALFPVMFSGMRIFIKKQLVLTNRINAPIVQLGLQPVVVDANGNSYDGPVPINFYDPAALQQTGGGPQFSQTFSGPVPAPMGMQGPPPPAGSQSFGGY